MSATDTVFAGSIPATYDRYMVPLIFAPYAAEVARRAQRFMPGHVLETAAGTGVVTEALHRALSDAEIIATDLNEPMLELAARRVRSDRVTFEPADAQALRRRQLRPRRVPVRSHVLPGQGEGQCRGAASAAQRRTLSAGHLGQGRPEPRNQVRGRGACGAISRRS